MLLYRKNIECQGVGGSLFPVPRNTALRDLVEEEEISKVTSRLEKC